MEAFFEFLNGATPVHNVALLVVALIICIFIIASEKIIGFIKALWGKEAKAPLTSDLVRAIVGEVVGESERRINQKFDDMAASLKKDLAAHDLQNEQDFRQIRNEINQINQNLINGKK